MSETWLTRMIADSNGRHFTAAEAERVAVYAESLPTRLAAARKVEAAGKRLAKSLADAVGPQATEWGVPADVLAGELLRAATSVAAAAVCDDRGGLATATATPLRLTAQALDAAPSEVAALVGVTWRLLAESVGPDAAVVLEPYFESLRADVAGEELS